MSNKKLALTWYNQDKAVLPDGQGGYEWVERDDPRLTEVRLLEEVDRVGEVTGTPVDNLLIQGDAYDALHALTRIPEYAEQYKGKVKLVYIDPPFNTKQTFDNYDDNFDHSIWLGLFRNYLRQLHRLLADDGVIWVHLDDNEVHRARLLLDEQFGISNFLGTVVWQKADGPRPDLPNFSPDHDTLLVYGKSGDSGLYRTERDKSLNSIYKSPDGDERPWYDGDPTAPSAHRNQTWVYAIQSPVTGELLYPANSRCWATKQETVLAAMSEWAPYRLEVIDDDERRADVCGVPVDDLRKGIPALLLDVPLETAQEAVEKRRAMGTWPEYIIRSRGGLGRKRYQPDTGSNTRTIWFNKDVGHNREAKAEIKALFPGVNPFATPKPERFLRRIIQVSTRPGDIVLDCFAGSGTTAAVAHKLERRWVTVETVRSTSERFTLPRLTKVVDGSDDGGISKARDRVTKLDVPSDVDPSDIDDARKVLEKLVGAGALDGDAETLESIVRQMKTKQRRERVWQGGGGFRRVNVAESMLAVAGDRTFLRDTGIASMPDYVAAQLGYSVALERSGVVGVKGKDVLVAVAGIVDDEQVKIALSRLDELETLTLIGLTIHPTAKQLLNDLRPGSRILKVPDDLVKRSKVIR